MSARQCTGTLRTALLQNPQDSLFCLAQLFCVISWITYWSGDPDSRLQMSGGESRLQSLSPGAEVVAGNPMGEFQEIRAEQRLGVGQVNNVAETFFGKLVPWLIHDDAGQDPIPEGDHGSAPREGSIGEFSGTAIGVSFINRKR